MSSVVDASVDSDETVMEVYIDAIGDGVADNSVVDTLTTDTENTCCICMHHNASVTIRNCNHKVVCRKCYKKIDKCPICRAEIERTNHNSHRIFCWLASSALLVTLALTIIPIIDNDIIKIFISLSIGAVWLIITIIIADIRSD